MSQIGYTDLPVVYIKYKDAKESFLAFLGMSTLIGGICLGIEVYFALHGLPIHPRPLFGFLVGFGFVLGMVTKVFPKLEKKWNMQDKSLFSMNEQKVGNDSQ